MEKIYTFFRRNLEAIERDVSDGIASSPAPLNFTMTSAGSLSSSVSVTSSSSSSYASFSRIDGLNTLPPTTISSSSQDPYYPSSPTLDSTTTVTSTLSSSSLSSESSGISQSQSSSDDAVSSQFSSFEEPVSSQFTEISTLTSTEQSTSTYTPSPSTLISSSSSYSPHQLDSSSLVYESTSVFVVTDTSTYSEYVSSSTLSYSQEYLITDPTTTFTLTVLTQTVFDYTVQPSGTVLVSSFTPTPITTDLAYYQTVLQNHEIDSDPSPNNTGRIVGGVLGAILGLGLALFLLWFFFKRHQKSSKDVENPFGGHEKVSAGFFGKLFSKKTSSSEDLNEKSNPFYGSNNESQMRSVANPVFVRGMEASRTITSRPSLPHRKSSEESLGLGGLSQNILSQDHSLTPNLNTTIARKTHQNDHYSLPEDQSAIINSNANSPSFPVRQMDILYEEDISDSGSINGTNLLKPPTTHYKKSSRYDHIGLTTMPPSQAKSPQPPPVPKPRKNHSRNMSRNSAEVDIYDTLDAGNTSSDQRLIDTESFDSSLLDMSSIDDISSENSIHS